MRPTTFRRMLNAWPLYLFMGVRTVSISEDWHVWELRLKSRLRNRNYVGTHFGGTMYAGLDPQFMLAFLHIFGKEFIVWDKAATIRFRRPGKGTLTARVEIPPGEVAEIRRLLADGGKVDRTYTTAWRDAEGHVVCEIEKVLHFRAKPPREAPDAPTRAAQASAPTPASGNGKATGSAGANR